MAILLIVSVASVAGFAAGQFSAQIEQATTTTSTTITPTETKTTTSTWKITETVTSTTAVVRDLPIPSPANSTAIIHGHFIVNGSIFVMLSIDKPTYVLGDIVHIKGIMTNLTPNNFSLSIWSSMIKIVDENITSRKTVWMSPEWDFAGGIGPLPMDSVDLKAEGTGI